MSDFGGATRGVFFLPEEEAEEGKPENVPFFFRQPTRGLFDGPLTRLFMLWEGRPTAPPPGVPPAIPYPTTSLLGPTPSAKPSQAVLDGMARIDRMLAKAKAQAELELTANINGRPQNAQQAPQPTPAGSPLDGPAPSPAGLPAPESTSDTPQPPAVYPGGIPAAAISAEESYRLAGIPRSCP